ncbi:YncE family protein [Streptomyces nitrosporeus]|uniref:YncE family protein n=1 Tax=Streptomyces nitrosporeus TaxID=28894 RepID=A0A5J6FJ09_9ACTN|nr:YncE family protein [Streptomyces nitrosporeus]QEU75976.1 YncE family protein [Streptomyces nitrosporeus]
MPLLHRRVHRAAASAVALAAVSTLTFAGAADAAVDAGATARLPVSSAPLVQGLYQSAYSERNDTLWATASVGQPPAPVTGSRLVRIDPDTLEVEATYPVPLDTADGTVEAVYGIDVDDEHNTLWVTNSRNDSVAVYSQATGRHLATLPGVAHAREIVVDEKRDTVWTTAFGSGEIVAFDSRTFRETDRVAVEGSGPTGLTVNERTGAVYASDFTHDRIIQVSPRTGATRLIPTGDGPLSVALSPNGRTVYTADQGAGTMSVVDLRTGAVTASVPTGAGAKSLATDRRSGRVLVVDRLAPGVSVVDPRAGRVVERVATAALPNHVQVTGDGVAYVLDKSASGPAGEDLGMRIELGRGR